MFIELDIRGAGVYERSLINAKSRGVYCPKKVWGEKR